MAVVAGVIIWPALFAVVAGIYVLLVDDDCWLDVQGKPDEKFDPVDDTVEIEF